MGLHMDHYDPIVHATIMCKTNIMFPCEIGNGKMPDGGFDLVNAVLKPYWWSVVVTKT